MRDGIWQVLGTARGWLRSSLAKGVGVPLLGECYEWRVGLDDLCRTPNLESALAGALLQDAI